MAKRSGAIHPSERRRKTRIQLTRGLIARFGGMGAIILDITDAGARIEHFNPVELRKTSAFRFHWNDRKIETSARVVSSRIHRFAEGADGTTVYQSGLFFTDYKEEAASALRDLISTVVTRSLAEQVANARGLGPVTQPAMPVFREGIVASTGPPAPASGDEALLPRSAVAIEQGYLRCVLTSDGRWQRKWNRTPDQPVEGFTVSAVETEREVEQLCQAYLEGSVEDRNLIRLMARLSVEKQ
jgi:hypothetical protein